MPRITIQAFRGRSVDQKRELVRRITADVVEVFGTTPDAVQILLQESDPENFSKGGVLELDRNAGAVAQGGR